MPTPNIYVRIALLIALFLLGCITGFYPEHLRLVNYKDKVQEIGKAQEQKNQDILKQQKLVTEGIKNDYENKLARIKSYYSGLHYSGSSNLSSTSQTLVRVNGFTTDPVFAEQCANTTAQLVSLQQWVKEQVGINEQ
jgi:hypothetical protein